MKDGRLRVKNESDHRVLRNTREFPESFVAEWDFQHHAPQGTAIIFFAARGNEGGSIFTPGLPKRAGRFGNYTGGEINSYHTSYTAMSRRSQFAETMSRTRWESDMPESRMPIKSD